ncbi:hypothetical protein Bhyg_09073 [Pseudolycoriella hygida]|uniref:Uncharacterized protein n=1 Tax=Pseudolycoriella hygida TaxID=35572 RepID=A0A9Q0N5V3_9DIPT|nr:hypothetical protein Bhyg_09073 [Pseudolycoriella hygida]
MLLIHLEIRNTSKKCFANFLKFVDKHNNHSKIYKFLELEKWSNQSFKHQIQIDLVNCGIHVLQFIKQYLKTGKIDKPFTPNEYRKKLQHLILRMTGARWTHIPCAECDENVLFDIHFFLLDMYVGSNEPSSTPPSEITNIAEDNVCDQFSQDNLQEVCVPNNQW